MTMLQQSVIAASIQTGYQISRSLRFNSPDSAYLARTPASNGNRQIWTFSGWIKRAALGSVQNIIRATDGASNDTLLRFESSDKIGVYTNATSNLNLQTAAVYRDTAAHFHVLLAVDTTQATASNRAKLYVNGVQITAFSTETYPTQNANTQFNSTSFAMNIGRYSSGAGSEYLSAYLSDIYFIDGQALTPSSFGETDATTGVWVPKAYAGTYGTNGFWLKFDDNSGTTSTTLGKDSSGNSNNWTPNNFSVTAGVGNDSLVDSPTWYGTDTGAGGEVRGNYATLNPLVSSVATLANGNLDWSQGATAYRYGLSTIAIPLTGKYIVEVVFNSTPTNNLYNTAGVINSTGLGYLTASMVQAGSGFYGVNDASSTYGQSFVQNGTRQGSITVPSGTVIQLLIDRDNNQLTFTKNGTLQTGTGSTVTIPSGVDLWAVVGDWGASGSVNFGQRPFAYTAPSGFKALCTTNLPTPAIGASAGTLASKNMNVLLWTGDNTLSRTISGAGFSPDLAWLKHRNSVGNHGLMDRVRGSTLRLISNSNAAEDSVGLSAFTSDGITTNSSTPAYNATGDTHAGWLWKAGGAPVTNTAGSISSQVSANTDAGISVVGYTANGSNATIGHGLGKAPSMIITKQRNGTWNWIVYHASIGAGKFLYLQSTDAQQTDATMYSASPSSTVFSIGTNGQINSNTSPYISYCFAEVAGFSKFGSYAGNGAADGVFVYTGFRPRWIMVKNISTAGDWAIIDTVRSQYNVSNATLYPNSNVAEDTAVSIDVLSNGFKLRGTAANGSGSTFVFAAFAESPFNYSRAR